MSTVVFEGDVARLDVFTSVSELELLDSVTFDVIALERSVVSWSCSVPRFDGEDDLEPDVILTLLMVSSDTLLSVAFTGDGARGDIVFFIRVSSLMTFAVLCEGFPGEVSLSGGFVGEVNRLDVDGDPLTFTVSLVCDLSSFDCHALFRDVSSTTVF